MEKQAPNDKAAQMRLMIAAYDKMGKALKATGRPIVYSLCQYGWDAVWEWAPALGGNLWRTTGDMTRTGTGIYAIVSQQEGLEKYAGPGHWNDPDMLEVGNGKLSLAENRAHFSMWAMLAAPLLAGNDLPNMKPEIKAILTNRDVIAIDQDKLGKQGMRAYSDGEVEVWTRHLAGGAMAIGVLNAGSDRYSTHPFHLNLAKLGLHGTQKGKDLWTGKDIDADRQSCRSSWAATMCCWCASTRRNRRDLEAVVSSHDAVIPSEQSSWKDRGRAPGEAGHERAVDAPRHRPGHASDSQTEGDRTVTYNQAGKHWTVTFVNDRATAIKSE